MYYKLAYAESKTLIEAIRSVYTIKDKGDV